MRHLLLLCDDNGWFWATFRSGNPTRSVSLDLEKLQEYLSDFNITICTYSGIDFSRDYQGVYVAYTSSEDSLLGTKDYVEDVLLWLKKQGAILIPDFDHFRAHHNKVYMELLRFAFKDKELHSLCSRVYCSIEQCMQNEKNFPVVVKSSEGAGSKGVFLVKDAMQLRKVLKSIARVPSIKLFLYDQLINTKRSFEKRQERRNPYNQKFIVQKFIPNLDGDYKVLIFGARYYVLHRLNRKNDFRASGSGRFVSSDSENLIGLIRFAKICKDNIDSPHVSLDIAFDGRDYHLIEFQCVFFGLKAMSLSQHYYEIDHGDNVRKVIETPISEEVYSGSLIEFIQRI